jgi:hypothetical protein
MTSDRMADGDREGPSAKLGCNRNALSTASTGPQKAVRSASSPTTIRKGTSCQSLPVITRNLASFALSIDGAPLFACCPFPSGRSSLR